MTICLGSVTLTANHEVQRSHLLPSPPLLTPPSVHPRGQFRHQLWFLWNILRRPKEMVRGHRFRALNKRIRHRFSQSHSAISFDQPSSLRHSTPFSFRIQLLLLFLNRRSKISSPFLFSRFLPFLLTHPGILLCSLQSIHSPPRFQRLSQRRRSSHRHYLQRIRGQRQRR
ncbi:hypothetical protein V8G54_011827 [Vigna mungo]|uniref:Uncharacterized protein n=1 Tax=Vigna mungo TaxID=3915 RepID=A0AAQ3NQB1_VIGMU